MNDDNADREPTATPAGPAAETGAADAAPTQENPEGWAPERSRKKTIFFAVAIVLGALAALYAWQLPPFRSDSQTTDNAYVRGQTTIISPQVTGYVTEVLVQDFAQVAAGQALVRIDDRIYRQRVAQGQAGIATQTASLDNAGQNRRSSEAQVRLQEASVANARAQLAKAQADMRRVDELADEGSVSLRERDQTRETGIDSQAANAAGHVNPVAFFRALDRVAGENAVFVADGGAFVATSSYILRPRGPLTWLDPGVFGTLGVGAGFALGASVARPGDEVWLLWGDGASGYGLAEFDTFVRHGIPVIAVVGNDAGWTQIAREQVKMLGDDVGTVLARTAYHEVARAFGAEGIEVRQASEVESALTRARALAGSGRPVLINVWLDRTDFREGSISM